MRELLKIDRDKFGSKCVNESMKMKKKLVLLLLFSLLSAGVLFAQSAKKEDLEKRIIELKAKQSEIAVRLNGITSEYTSASKKIQSLRKDLRKGKAININYDKTGVDEETATLIDRYRAAEKKAAELKKELDEHLAKSDAGVERAKKFDEEISTLKAKKKSLNKVIQQRAEILQEQAKNANELKLAEDNLKAINSEKQKGSK